MSAKRMANRDALRALLADHIEHSQAECLAVAGYRYGARLFELRREGLRIVTEPKGGDEFSYRLLRDREPHPDFPIAGQAELFA